RLELQMLARDQRKAPAARLEAVGGECDRPEPPRRPPGPGKTLEGLAGDPRERQHGRSLVSMELAATDRDRLQGVVRGSKGPVPQIADHAAEEFRVALDPRPGVGGSLGGETANLAGVVRGALEILLLEAEEADDVRLPHRR